MRQAARYSKISKRFLLCVHEKLAVALYPNPEELLNKSSEMISKCRRLNKFLLMNFIFKQLNISLMLSNLLNFNIK